MSLLDIFCKGILIYFLGIHATCWVGRHLHRWGLKCGPQLSQEVLLGLLWPGVRVLLPGATTAPRAWDGLWWRFLSWYNVTGSPFSLSSALNLLDSSTAKDFTPIQQWFQQSYWQVVYLRLCLACLLVLWPEGQKAADSNHVTPAPPEIHQLKGPPLNLYIWNFFLQPSFRKLSTDSSACFVIRKGNVDYK